MISKPPPHIKQFDIVKFSDFHGYQRFYETLVYAQPLGLSPHLPLVVLKVYQPGDVQVKQGEVQIVVPERFLKKV
jgi:hypothetical protein